VTKKERRRKQTERGNNEGRREREPERKGRKLLHTTIDVLDTLHTTCRSEAKTEEQIRERAITTLR
jgi:hypothetical protein